MENQESPNSIVLATKLSNMKDEIKKTLPHASLALPIAQVPTAIPPNTQPEISVPQVLSTAFAILHPKFPTYIRAKSY